MLQLSDKITDLLCPKHESLYSFIYAAKLDKKKSRMMCDQCIGQQSAKEFINIRLAFEFLEEQRIQEDQRSYQCRLILWQQFKHGQSQIIEILKQLELQMENVISSIFENQVIYTLRNYYFDKAITYDNVDKLGNYLSSVITQDIEGQYQFKKQDELYEQCGFNQCFEILSRQKQAIHQWSQNLSSIVDAIQKRRDIIQMQKLEVANYTYKVSQTLQLNILGCWANLSQNDKQLVVADGISIAIFNLSQQRKWVLGEFPYKGHTDLIWQVKFNHNSTQIASCSDDKQIIIWNKQPDGNWSIQEQLSSHDAAVLAICFNHNSTLLASGSIDKSIKIHGLQDGKWQLQQSITEFTHAVTDVCFNYNSTLLVSGGGDNLIKIWKLHNNGSWATIQTLNEHTNVICSVQFNIDSTKLVSSSWDKTIKIWIVDKKQIWKCSHTLVGHTDTVFTAYFNKYSNMIVSSSADKSIRIWKFNKSNNWECKQTINQHKNEIKCAILSSDSTMMVSSSFDKTIITHTLKH